jgi:hypothetical protein
MQQVGPSVSYEELGAALAGRLAAEKEAAMDGAHTRVGTHVTRGVRLASALDNQDCAAAVVDASVSLAVRFH